MPRVLLFGAGDGGKICTYALNSDYEILAYVDNDPQKAGKHLAGKKIIMPKYTIRIM